MNILLADDHPLFREGVKHVLMLLGEHVRIFDAHDYPSMFAEAAARPDLDLVLADLYMPGMGGHEGVAEFRNQFPDTPLVIMTASESRADARRVLASGALGYVLKSSPSQEMLDALIRVLPFGRTVVPADASFFVEVEFTVVGSPAHSDHPLSPADARRRIAALEDGLHSMGLHERTGNLARSDGTLVAQVACHRRGTVAETNAVAAGRTEWPNRMHLVRPTRTDEGRSRRGESRTHAADPKVSSPR